MDHVTVDPDVVNSDAIAMSKSKNNLFVGH